ncbi:MAG: hypothetical protein EOO11_23310 [Chitinophagaceae bacterium]|nr:MAG: hypothetical protein EOO11_23310 [Chitinophagaceae bacterium]
MAYQIEAFIGKEESLQLLAAAYPAVRLVALEQGLYLAPMTPEVFRALNGEDEHPDVGSFMKMTVEVERSVRATIGGALLGYIEADYFGGSGGQQGIVWKDGRRIDLEQGHGAINSVLWRLGVQALEGQDRFESVGLDRERGTDDWLSG